MCQGQTLSRTADKKLYDWVVANNLLEQTAGDGKPFGLGDGSTTFTNIDLRNKTTFGVDPIGDLTTVGAMTNGKLPNITGDNFGTTLYGNYYSGSGAFRSTQNGSNGKGNSGYYENAWTFDASRCSSIYTDSHNRVTPSSIGVNYMIKVM